MRGASQLNSPDEGEVRLVAMTAHATGDKQDPSTRQPGPGSAAPEHSLNPLQRLIRQRMGERGWSYGEVARRGGLPRSTVYTLAMTRNLGRPPRPATIDALAKGLDAPVSVVRTAAAESTGLHYYDRAPTGQPSHDDRERELLIASIDELSPDDRRHVAALVESLRNRDSSSHQPRLPRDFGGAIPAASLHWPARGHAELIGEFLIGVLR